MTQVYVYDGKEVFLTGRTAAKQGRRGKERILHEVRAIKYLNQNNQFADSDWVAMRELYEINTEDATETETNE